MDELLLKLLEQTPVIIVMGIGLYVLQAEKRETKEETQEERLAHIQQITELTNKHTNELKGVNNYIKERDLETLKALEDTSSAFQTIQTLISDIKPNLSEVKTLLENKLRLLD